MESPREGRKQQQHSCFCLGEFSFCHKTAGWDKDRRYIVVRQDNEILDAAKGHQMSLFKEDEVFSKYRFACYVTTFDS